MPSPQLKLINTGELLKENPRLSDFDWFWSEYPRKKAKLDAQRAWQQTRTLRPDMEILIAAIHAQFSGPAIDLQYVPYPATWLRAGQWDDE